MSIFEQILSILAPHYCLGCGAEGATLCTTCAGRLPRITSRCYRCGRATTAFRTCPVCGHKSDAWAAIAATRYEGHAKQVIHRLKFERAGAAAEDIAAVLAKTIAASGLLPTI